MSRYISFHAALYACIKVKKLDGEIKNSVKMGSYSRYYFKLKGIKFNYTLTLWKEKASETEKLAKVPINVLSPQRD